MRESTAFDEFVEEGEIRRLVPWLTDELVLDPKTRDRDQRERESPLF